MLHDHDEIGLLRPSTRTDYRQYDDDEMSRLRQIPPTERSPSYGSRARAGHVPVGPCPSGRVHVPLGDAYGRRSATTEIEVPLAVTSSRREVRELGDGHRSVTGAAGRVDGLAMSDGHLPSLDVGVFRKQWIQT